MLKTGQTINIEGRWGTVTYLIGDNMAIVTMDDDLQVQAWLESLRLPPFALEALALKPWTALPEDLAEQARVRHHAGEMQVKTRVWLAQMGYDVQVHDLKELLKGGRYAYPENPDSRLDC